MDGVPSSQPPQYPYDEGRLPMSEEELRIVERNRRLTRRILVPLMGTMGACGVAGGIWAITTDSLAIGIGLVSSALTMLGFAGYFALDTKKPIVRPEKFFVTGVMTSKRKRGSVLTQVYYEVNLNGDKYRCYVSKKDFARIKPGDIVQCERLAETSVYADRVTVMSNFPPPANQAT